MEHLGSAKTYCFFDNTVSSVISYDLNEWSRNFENQVRC